MDNVKHTFEPIKHLGSRVVLNEWDSNLPDDYIIKLSQSGQNESVNMKAQQAADAAFDGIDFRSQGYRYPGENVQKFSSSMSGSDDSYKNDQIIFNNNNSVNNWLNELRTQ